MSDIVERLREWSERTERAIAAPHRLCDDAADEITRLRAVSGVIQDDMAALMEALGISTHARDASPHEVMVDEVIPEARRLRAVNEQLIEYGSADYSVLKREVIRLRAREEELEGALEEIVGLVRLRDEFARSTTDEEGDDG